MDIAKIEKMFEDTSISQCANFEGYEVQEILDEVKAKIITEAVNKNDLLQSVINWNDATNPPKDKYGDYLVRLENNSIVKATYSRMVGERWFVAGISEITSQNPVKYWAELPK